MCTFIGNYSVLDYFDILFILDLDSEFRNFKLWDQELFFKGLVYKFLRIISEGLCDINLKGTVYLHSFVLNLVLFFFCV